MNRRTSLLLFLVLPSMAAAIGISLLYQSARPNRFAEVEPGRLYRGAFPTEAQLRSMRDELGLRTIVSLTDDDGRSAPIKKEQPVVESLGMRFFRFPMPGDGRGSFAALDGAADQLASVGNGPLFFHCSAGKQRSNATLAAYRMKHGGWPLERALEELDSHGLDRHEEAGLCEHLRGYAAHLASASSGPASAPTR